MIRRGGGARCLPVTHLGSRLGGWLGWLAVGLLLAGCQRGCARSWFERHGVGEPGGAPKGGGGGTINAVDCPDGVARCADGVVEVSRLATIPQPCIGRPEGCTCPWERLGECGHGCVVEGEPLVLERRVALRQLCVPEPDAGPLTHPASAPGDCSDDDVQYRCSGGAVIACARHAVVAICEHGCASEGLDIGVEERVDREAAFAILCSR